jgi:hypothetical protein
MNNHDIKLWELNIPENIRKEVASFFDANGNLSEVLQKNSIRHGMGIDYTQVYAVDPFNNVWSFHCSYDVGKSTKVLAAAFEYAIFQEPPKKYAKLAVEYYKEDVVFNAAYSYVKNCWFDIERMLDWIDENCDPYSWDYEAWLFIPDLHEEIRKLRNYTLIKDISQDESGIRTRFLRLLMYAFPFRILGVSYRNIFGLRHL